jgi:predicted alpha/beta-hydrolase family hydrolase
MSAAALRRFTAAVVLGLLLPAAAAQDYAREKRWESEVVGNLVVGEPVKLALKSGHAFLALYTPVPNAHTAIVLVHGIGVHPDHGVIGVLRSTLADRGYTTLSIQMPVQASDAGAEAYTPAVFDEAVERIAVAAAWLQTRGVKNIVLLSHSMGSRMSLAYWNKTRNAPYVAWVCLGIPAAFSGLSGMRAPILDVHGEFDLPAVRAQAAGRAREIESIAGSREVVVAGADHFYNGRETQLADAIVAFLRAQGMNVQ